MASAEEFKGAVKRLMQQSGSLDVVQAHVRSEILKALYAGERSQPGKDAEPESMVLNEMIREYLRFQGYDAAASVFIKEARLDDQALSRGAVESHVGASCWMHEDRLPLLYSLVRSSSVKKSGTR